MQVIIETSNDSSPEVGPNMTFPKPAAENCAVARVLVVDDEPLIRWSLAETLTQRGHIVTEAGDAKTTHRILTGTADRPDVVLLDYRLPDSNDLRLFAEIKRKLPESQIILMTAHGTADIARDALALGAYSVVGKPFEVKDLARLVQEALASGRSH
jgi:two-component system response regulator AtoC